MTKSRNFSMKTVMQVYIVARHFKSIEECLADMENPVFEADIELKAFCGEIFGDG